MNFVVAAIVVLIVLAAWIVVMRRRLARASAPFAMKIEAYTLEDAFGTIAADFRDSLDDSTMRAEIVALDALVAGISDDIEGLVILRREIMDRVDRRMLSQEILDLPFELRQRLRASSAEIIQNDDGLRRFIGVNEFQLELLRQFAAGRFHDRADNDWYAVYEKAARMRRRVLRHFLERSMDGSVQQMDDVRQQAITVVDSQLRLRLLQLAPGTQFKLPADMPHGSAESH